MQDKALDNYLHKEIRKIRMATFAKTPQLSLGDLIDKFEDIKVHWEEDNGVGNLNIVHDKTVQYDFGSMIPDGMHSYRGSYCEFAIGYKELDYGTKRVSAVEFLKDLKEAVGHPYEGWKGGIYFMSKETPIWVAQDGDSVNSGVVGLHDDTTQIIILTAYCEF